MPIPIIDTITPNGPFPIVNDLHMKGGFRVVLNDAERNAIPLERQTVGMRVFVSSTNTLYRLVTTAAVLTGSNFSVDAASVHNTGIISGCVIDNPSTNVVTLGAGTLALRGQLFTVGATLTAPAPAASGEQICVYNTISGTLLWRTHEQALTSDFVLAFAAVTTSAFTKFEIIAPASVLGLNVFDEVLVSKDADKLKHFTSPHHALLWIYAHVLEDIGAKKLTVLDDFMVLDERVGLPGTITGVNTVTGAISGSSTRFLRDFAVGDWIGLGGTAATNRTWARVTAVASDISLTVASVTAVTVPAVYSRALAHGPHAETLHPSLTGLGGELHGLRFRGVTSKGQYGTYIDWGFAKGAGTTPNTDNVPFFGIPDTSRHWYVSDMQWEYLGASADLNYDACNLKGLGEENQFDNIYFSGATSGATGRGLNCHLNISNNPYADLGTPSIVFSRCKFAFIGATATHTEMSMIRGTVASASGQVKFEKCTLEGSAKYLVSEADAESANNIDFIFEDCDVGTDGLIAFIKHRHTGDDAIRMLQFKHCRLNPGSTPKIGVTSTADVVTDRPHVDLIECAFIAPVNFLGARHVSGTLQSGSGYTLNTKGSFDVYVNAGAGTSGTPKLFVRRNDGDLRVTTLSHVSDPVDSAVGVAGLHFLRGQDLALTTSFGGQCSRILAGGGFQFDGSLGANLKIKLKPGTYRFANSTVLSTTADINADPTANAYTGQIFVYLTTAGTLVTPFQGGVPEAPTVRGIPSVNGNTDYCYVGSFMADAGSATNCRVVTMTGTQRLVSMADSGIGDAAYIGNHQAATLQTSTTLAMYDTTNNGAGANADNPRTLALVTARTLRWSLNMFWASNGAAAPGGGVGTLTWQAGGLKAIPFYFPSAAFWRGNAAGVDDPSHIVPQSMSFTFETLNAETPALTVAVPAGWAYLFYATLQSFTEDANAPRPWL